MKRALLLVVLALCCARANFGQGTIQTILTNGPTSNRINIVFLSEGFTSAQLGTYLVNATNFLNGLLAAPPYSEYRKYFNAFAISIASTQSGSDHPGQNSLRNTYFNSSYDSYGTPYLITIPPNDRDSTYANGQGKIDALLARHLPEFDISILIVNDTAYGGSGGTTAISSVETSAREIVIHELGHSFARLGDEYDAAYPGYPDIEEPNTTRETRRDFIKWNAWINASTPVPTPTTFTTQIGLFEGAHYHTTGWYRPKFNCKMRTLGQAFCSVCAEAIVKTAYGLINPIDVFSPATGLTHSITNSDSITFNLAALEPATHSLAVEWRINGAPVPTATGSTFAVTAYDLASGANTIRAIVSDNTPLVRVDPTLLLQQTLSWNVNATITPPSLSARLQDGVRLSFPANAAGFVIESTAQIGPGAVWNKITQLSELSGGEFVVTIPANDFQQYFRLKADAP